MVRIAARMMRFALGRAAGAGDGAGKDRSSFPPMKTLGAASIRRLVEALQATPLYRQYQQAFRQATGLSMMLRLAADDEMPSLRERAEQNAFCQALTSRGLDCDACAASRAAVKQRSGVEGSSGECFAHLSLSALPVRVGENLVAYLWTGQVFAPGVRARGFGSIEKMLRRAGAGEEERERLRELWEATPEVPTERYESIVTLLRVFARQLGDSAATLLLQAAPQEPEAVHQARRYVRDRLGERLTLEEVARHVGLSRHHFSRLFRQASGLTLTEYINRSRIEVARQLLLRADARVSEVAFEVGYQSLSQFNRSFLRIAGRSPLDYRRQILRPEAARRAS